MFGLFFSGNEEYLLAGFCYALESSSGLVDLSGGLVEVYDVDTVALHKYIGRHSRIPFSLEVTEMAIARALVKINPEDKHALRVEGFMTRDPRAVERKKPGQPKARKRFQFSKR